MRGSGQLRIELEAIERSTEPIRGANWVLKHRPLRDVSALERDLLCLLADVENALAHVRLMRAGQENDLVKQITRRAAA